MTQKEAEALRDEIEEICEDAGTSEFLEDIQEKSASVCETIDKSGGRVTERQAAALESWAAAARKFQR